ncbi:MAG: methionine synthase [Chloroflexi bacterium]|nr:methionine synthase [Chloroflexota bacterium]
MTELDRLRVDQVGSLLRPEALKAAFERHGRGEASTDVLREAEDQSIREVVRHQEAHHLPIVTDGEFRRLNFQDSFAQSVSGFDAQQNSAQITERRSAGGEALQRWASGTHESGPAVVNRRPVAERLRLARNVPLEEYRFVSQLTRTPAKVTFIGPDRVAQRFAWEESRAIYPGGLDEFTADLVAIQRQLVAELVEAGCRYVHIDAPSYTAYVDEPSLEQMRARGEDPQANLARSIAADNTIIEGFSGVTFGIHLCRGNQRSMWHREGSYDSIAEQLFTSLKHQRLLLEYDDERSGSFAPLRFVRKGATAVLGLITTKTPREETVDGLRRRLDEAARYLPADQLAISPQCGFASDMPGNLLTEADQWRKLDVMIETANAVWGAA